MIFRYSRKAMAHIWSEENKFAAWLKVELAAMSALAEAGIIPAEVPQRAREKAECDPERILAIEKETHHDVAAFVDQVASCLGEDGRYLPLRPHLLGRPGHRPRPAHPGCADLSSLATGRTPGGP